MKFKCDNTAQDAVFFTPPEGLKFAATTSDVWIEIQGGPQSRIDALAEKDGGVMLHRDVFYHRGIWTEKHDSPLDTQRKLEASINATSLRLWILLRLPQVKDWDAMSELVEQFQKDWLLCPRTGWPWGVKCS
jgi:hypothetical protein